MLSPANFHLHHIHSRTAHFVQTLSSDRGVFFTFVPGCTISPLLCGPSDISSHRFRNSHPTTPKSSSIMADQGCFNCGAADHQARNCPKKAASTCYNCGQAGHLSRDCTEAPKPKSCYKCGQEGHLARDCTSADAVQGQAPSRGFAGNSYGGRECYKCGGRGHIAKDCVSSGNGWNQGGARGGQTCYVSLTSYVCHDSNHIIELWRDWSHGEGLQPEPIHEVLQLWRGRSLLQGLLDAPS